MHQSSGDAAKQNEEENGGSKGKGKGKAAAPEREETPKADTDGENGEEEYNRLANRPKRKRAGKITEEDLKRLKEEEGDDYDSEDDEDFE
jgi:hypothetical protein